MNLIYCIQTSIPSLSTEYNRPVPTSCLSIAFPCGPLGYLFIRVVPPEIAWTLPADDMTWGHGRSGIAPSQSARFIGEPGTNPAACMVGGGLPKTRCTGDAQGRIRHSVVRILALKSRVWGAHCPRGSRRLRGLRPTGRVHLIVASVAVAAPPGRRAISTTSRRTTPTGRVRDAA
jgi:hypothetical protein